MANYTNVFDQNSARDMVVAANEDNELADTQFAQDIRTAPYQILVDRYGQEVADNRRMYGEERVRQSQIENSERSIQEAVGDTAAGVAAGFVGTVGSVVGAGIGGVGYVAEKLGEDGDISAYATRYVETTDKVTTAIRSLQSDELRDKQGLSGVEAQLDAADNQAEYDRNTNNGEDAGFLDNLAWVGRGAMNNAGRVMSDGAVAADVVAQGIGSLGPSAKIASVASKIVTGSRTYNAAKIAHAVAPTQATSILARGADAVNRSAIAVAVGGTEAAGVYSQTVNSVLGMKHGELMEGSVEYAELIAKGVSQDDAKAQIAAHSGMDAFGRQFPQAVALGIITARFEAAPITSFRGAGFVGGLRSVGAQTLEEGGQGATGQMSENIAIQNNADWTRETMEGVPQAFSEGAIAGTGMAGIMAAPAAIGNTPRVVIDGVRDGAAAVSGSKAVSAIASAAATGLDGIQAVSSAASKTRAGIASITATRAAAAKAAEVATPVIAAATDAMSDVNKRPDRKLQLESLENIGSVQQLSDAELNTGENESVTGIARTPSEGPVPTAFSDYVPEGGTAIDNVTGVLTTMAQKSFKMRNMSDGDALYAAEQFSSLSKNYASLPKAIQNQVTKVLSSPDYALIKKRVEKIDQNTTQTDATVVDETTTAETVAMSGSNPANVNPDFVNKVVKTLEQGKTKSITPKKMKFLKLSAKISSAINKRVGDSVEMTSEKNVGLQRIADERGDKAKLDKVTPVESVSRDFSVGDLKNSAGKSRRSVAEFAQEIVLGLQNADQDGKYFNVNGESSNVSRPIVEFGKLVKHMANKVGALNTSFDQRDGNNKGSAVRFESLSVSGSMVPATSTGGSPAITYQAGSPGGIKFAKEVYADAALAAEVYNQMVDAFPESFPNGRIEVPDIRTIENASQSDKPTAVEAEGLPKAQPSNEQTPEVVPVKASYSQAQVERIKDNRLEEMLNNLKKKKADGLLTAKGQANIDLFEADKARRAKNVVEATTAVEENVSQETFEENAVITEYQARLDGKETQLVVTEGETGAIATYSKNKNTVSVNSGLAQADFDAGLTYIDGGDGVASEQKAEVFKNVDVETFKAFMKDKGFDTYLKFIIEHELEHARQINRGEVYPRNADGTADLMNPEAIRMERGANQAGFDAVGFTGPVAEPVPINQKVFNLPAQFEKSFIPLDEDMDYSDGQELVAFVSEVEGTSKFVQFVQDNLQPLMDGANLRLKIMKTTSTDDLTIFDRIVDGQDTTTFRRNKNTMFVEPTGAYDPDLLSIASVAVLDWLTTVRSNNPSNLGDMMEDMGVEFSDLTDSDVESMMFGVAPRDAAEQLAKQVTRLWGMRLNKDEGMSDTRGAIEGLVKELLSVVSDTQLKRDKKVVFNGLGLIKTELVPYFDKESEKMVTQAVFNVRGMAETQQEIGLGSQGAITQMVAPEMMQLPSIGKTIGEVDQTQSRGDVDLSKLERTALKNMQDTAHMLADTLSALVSSIGFDNIAPYLGKQSSELMAADHPLRASIEGKNLSIQRDFDEAMMIIQSIRDKGLNEDGLMASVYYRIGISKVGRHQFKGINPQNNKILRALVTPTHATLDMTTQKHKDAFWLTVSQGSGINKVENQNHKKILGSIQTAFDAKYGEATQIVLDHLNGAEMDGAALITAMGPKGGDMQQLATVYAVASLKKAQADGTEASFDTTLSFELDGKTDGPGNMMVNFGQGIMDALEFTNFKRVGFFLGTTAMTLNKFFGGNTEVDLYEVTAKRAMKRYKDLISESKGKERDQLLAMQNFATAFGDFELSESGEFSMTRTTAKNPMTKTVYGSSETGVGSGLASEMSIEMYRQLIATSGNISQYPGGHANFVKDFELLFDTGFPRNTDWNKAFLDKKSMKDFTFLTTATLGKVLSETAKSVIGNKITEVNDNLVLMTSFQTEFLTAKFEELLQKMIDRRVADGSNEPIQMLKNGRPNMTMMTQRDYDAVVAEIKTYSPTYANGMQTLDIGSLSPTDSGIRLSSTMDEKFSMNSSMISPELAGVKVIPYITQGRGDAMMMNRIYGGESAPTGTLNVFDGIDMAIDKIGDYAQTINESVMANWDADVLGDVVNDFTSFFDKTANDGELLIGAWKRAFEGAKAKNSTTQVTSPEGLISTILEMQRLNQARKTVFRKIGVSVDHMGGSDSAFVRGQDGREYSMGEINNMISQELGLIPTVETPAAANEDGSIDGEFTDVTPEGDAAPLQIEDKRTPVEGEFSKLVVTDPESLMAGLLRETRNKTVQKSVRILMGQMPNDARVVIGSAIEVSSWYTQNIGDMDKALVDQKGIYDPTNNVMLITNNNPETLIHEMIHMATFNKVEAFYNGDLTNEGTIGRLEKLSSEFMEADFSNNTKEIQDAANSAKDQILSLSSKTDAFSKAAALNEFMAWTLSNEALAKELQDRPSSVVSKLTRTVKALMQRLLGSIPTDMFNNILFNTDLLISGEGEGDIGDTGGNNNDGNDDGELTPAAQNLTNFWIDLVKARLEALNNTITVGTNAARLQFNDYRKNARGALDALNQGGFSLSAYQKETFAAIHTVLAMEMRLDTQSSIALNDLFEFVTDNLTPEMFGPNNTQDRYSTIMELFGGTKNDEQISDAIAVLLALSQTSDGFRRALDKLPTPPSNAGVSTVSLNEFLGSVTGMLMSKAVGSIDTAEGSIKDTLDNLSESILVEESEREFRILSGLMKNIDKADAYISGGFKALAGYTETRNMDVQNSNRSELTKIVSNTITAATAFMVEDKAKIMAQSLKEVTHMGTSLDRFVFVREFVTEAVGTDGTNGELVALLDRTNFAQSGVRQNYREDLPIHLQNGFQTAPNDEQWTATHHVMGKTDFSAVFDPYNVKASFRLISDEGFLDKKIAQAEAVLRSNMDTVAFDDVTVKGQQLADYMNGKGAGHQLLTNAFLINKLSGGYVSGMTLELDKLISMYAIKGTPVAQRLIIKELYLADPEGVTNLATYTKALNKEEDLKTTEIAAQLNGYKGFIPDHGAEGVKTVIAKDSERQALEKQGYIRIGDATADSDFTLTSRGYYTTSTKQTGTYSQGIMQTVQDSYRGVNSITGLSVNGSTSGVIAGDAVESLTDDLTAAGTVTDPKEALIPRFDMDETGDITVQYYERAINPDIIEKYQAPKSNMALMLGAWAGRQVEEKFAQKYNDELVIELKRVHDERDPNTDDLYVNLPAEKKAMDEWNDASPVRRKQMRKPDPIFVDSWNVISPRTKAKIEEVWGSNNFMVRKDQMNLALGYRDPSIIDMWTGNTRVPQVLQESIKALSGMIAGKAAMKSLAAIEGTTQGVISTAKDLIVVRSLIVPYLNTQANVFQLQTRGIPVKQMWKQYPDKLAEIEQLNVNSKKIIQLETQIQLAGIDKNRVAILEQQIVVIESQNARMGIAPLIQAGAYKNISEGITELDVDITSGRLGDWVEAKVNKFPSGVQTIAKYGLLSKDTALYKGANKAVQYGDFIAKAIYYDHLTTQKKLSHDDAMKLVNEEFVNFSVLPGRTRQYMEGIGATWFLTFKIRIMKIAMNQIRENPARALIVGSTVGELGSPVADNLATVIANDEMGYALGWEMLFGSVTLNPWLNVTDWN